MVNKTLKVHIWTFDFRLRGACYWQHFRNKITILLKTESVRIRLARLDCIIKVLIDKSLTSIVLPHSTTLIFHVKGGRFIIKSRKQPGERNIDIIKVTRFWMEVRD